MFEFRLGKVASQVPAFNVLNLPPGDPQVIRDVLDRHALPQLQHVPLKGPSVAMLRHRERNRYLWGSAAGIARDSRDSRLHEGRDCHAAIMYDSFYSEAIGC